MSLMRPLTPHDEIDLHGEPAFLDLRSFTARYLDLIADRGKATADNFRDGFYISDDGARAKSQVRHATHNSTRRNHE